MAQDVSEYCAEQVRRYDHDRWLAALFAPEARRRHLMALYAFNLEIAKIRELVRESMMGQIRLQWWREALDEVFAGKIRAHLVVEALAPVLQSGLMQRAGFDRLIDAREIDLAEAPPADLAALESYAEASSGALNELALDILAVGDPASRVAARHVGIAWALAGLIRAVPHQARRRQTFIPSDLLAGVGVTLDALFEGRPGPGLARAIEPVAVRAREHLGLARRARGVPAARPVLLLARLAGHYLHAIDQAGYDPFDPRLGRPSTLNAVRLGFAAISGRY